MYRIQGVQKFLRIVGPRRSLRCKKFFFKLVASRNLCSAFGIEYGGRTTRGEKEKENGRQRTSKCSVDKFLSQQNGQSYRPPPRFYSGVFATLARLDQQNSVCLVTLAQARLKPRIDLKVSYVFPPSTHRSFSIETICIIDSFGYYNRYYIWSTCNDNRNKDS